MIGLPSPRSNRWVGLAIFCTVFFLPGVVGAVDILVRPGDNRYLMAIEPIRVDASLSAAGADLNEISDGMTAKLRHLCKMSGYFQLLDPMAHIEKPESSGITSDKINYSLWDMLTVDYLIKGEIHFENKELVAELRLFEVKGSRFKTGRQYRGSPDQWPMMARKFANKILESISGVSGVFDTWILYERKEPTASGKLGKKGIYMRDMDGDTPPVRLVYDEAHHLFDPIWSPDGKRIAYLTYADTQSLVIRDLASGNQRIVRLKASQQILGVAWSPNGEHLAVTASEHGYSDILLMDADTFKVKGPVGRTWSNEFGPSFGPGGKRIALVSERSGTPQIYIMNLDGSGLKRLTFNGRFNVSPAISPDGKRIAYVHEEKESSNTGLDRILSIYVMDIEGKRHERITIDTGHNEAPTWSPDGRYLVFQSDRDGEKALYMMAADIPMQARRLGENSPRLQESSPVWSPGTR